MIPYQIINEKLPTDKGGSETDDKGGENVVVESLGRYVARSMDRIVVCSVGVHSAFYGHLPRQAVWVSKRRVAALKKLKNVLVHHCVCCLFCGF